MKKILVLFAMVAAMVACGNKTTNVIVDTDTVGVANDTTEVVVEAVDTVDAEEVLAE